MFSIMVIEYLNDQIIDLMTVAMETYFGGSGEVGGWGLGRGIYVIRFYSRSF